MDNNLRTVVVNLAKNDRPFEFGGISAFLSHNKLYKSRLFRFGCFFFRLPFLNLEFETAVR